VTVEGRERGLGDDPAVTAPPVVDVRRTRLAQLGGLDGELLAENYATLTRLTAVSIGTGDAPCGPVSGLELRERPVAARS
jgi:hypothetical protein